MPEDSAAQPHFTPCHLWAAASLGGSNGYPRQDGVVPLQESPTTCTTTLSPCAICCDTRGERIAFLSSPDCRAGRLTTWRKGNLQLVRWPCDSRQKISLAQPRAFGCGVTNPSCRWFSCSAVGCQAWSLRHRHHHRSMPAHGAQGGGGVGVSPGGAGGGRAAADTNQPNPSAHRPWKPLLAKAAAASLAGMAASAGFPPRGCQQGQARGLSAKQVLPCWWVPHA